MIIREKVIEKLPKVLVGCPTWENMEKYLIRFIGRVKGLTYPNYEIVLVDSSKDGRYFQKLQEISGSTAIKSKHISDPPRYRRNQCEALNTLRDYFLMNKYDYLLSLEQDILPPQNIIESLLFYDEPIVSALYRERKNEWIVSDYDELRNEFDLKKYEPIVKSHHGILKVKNCGLGCALVRRDVIEKVKFRLGKHKVHPDAYFYVDVAKLGIPAYVLLPMEVTHLKLEESGIEKFKSKIKEYIRSKSKRLFKITRYLSSTIRGINFYEK